METPKLIPVTFHLPIELVTGSPNSDDIIAECRNVCELLLTKNRAYGSSFCKPIHIFSKLDNVSAINARMDDKLARIKQAADFSEDTEADLIGYLVLKRIAIRMENEKQSPPKESEFTLNKSPRCDYTSEYGWGACVRPFGHGGNHAFPHRAETVDMCGFTYGGAVCDQRRGHSGMHNLYHPTKQDFKEAKAAVSAPASAAQCAPGSGSPVLSGGSAPP